jgi:hypothetical protein
MIQRGKHASFAHHLFLKSRLGAKPGHALEPGLEGSFTLYRWFND